MPVETNDASPESATFREAIAGVAATLRVLHAALVEGCRARYEIEHGPIEGPMRLLTLLTTEAEFLWLRALSGLMVDVDELLDLRDISEADARAVRAEVEGLIASSAQASEFAERYHEALQADTDVVIAHGRVRTALKQLPSVDEAAPSDHAERRRNWPLRRAELRKRL